MSETVERRLVELLGHPTTSPYGNPIPALEELGEPDSSEDFLAGLVPLTGAVNAGGDPVRVVVRRISEPLQTDTTVMSALRRVGALPQQEVLASTGPLGVVVARGQESAEIDDAAASHIFVHAV